MVRDFLSTLLAGVAIAAAPGFAADGQAPLQLISPNGELVLEFRLTDRGELRYGLRRAQRTVLDDCGLGLEIGAPPPGDAGWTIAGAERTAHDSTWRPVYGERSLVRDHYHQLAIDLVDRQPPPRRLRMTFRAYDQGVAFAYTVLELPGQTEVEFRGEKSEFRFLEDAKAWAVYSAQGRYEQVPLSGVKKGCERPLTVALPGGCWVALAEARLVDYARMKLAPSPTRPLTLVSDLSGPVRAALPMTTPWRVVMLADNPRQLLENNDLILNLNEPCAIEDTSWIRPGKVLREVTLTTAGGKACVDFAATHGLQFVEFDAGWYGHEYDDQADATTVTVDPQRSPGPLDLQEVIAYGRQRGIGVLLYVNRRALARQLDEILPLYQRWGVSGVKYGFVNVGSQEWTRWLHEAVRKAAAHRLMVDVHDEYRPTGYSRTYPNLMTQEGIAGDETSPTNEQTLTILFTRMLAGAADNTICYYDDRVSRNASHAYQLAKTVCLYSPWQFVFWYDRPPQSPHETGGAGGSQRRIGGEPELEFFARVPTVWDDTRVLAGDVGRYAVIARRSGNAWYLGCMNGDQPRTLPVPLGFLEPGRRYRATRYFDDPASTTRTGVGIEVREVNSATTLELRLPARGGEALRIVPVEDDCPEPGLTGRTARREVSGRALAPAA